jgi:GATA zinc finger
VDKKMQQGMEHVNQSPESRLPSFRAAFHQFASEPDNFYRSTPTSLSAQTLVERSQPRPTLVERQPVKSTTAECVWSARGDRKHSSTTLASAAALASFAVQSGSGNIEQVTPSLSSNSNEIVSLPSIKMIHGANSASVRYSNANTNTSTTTKTNALPSPTAMGLPPRGSQQPVVAAVRGSMATTMAAAMPSRPTNGNFVPRNGQLQPPASHQHLQCDQQRQIYEFQQRQLAEQQYRVQQQLLQRQFRAFAAPAAPPKERAARPNYAPVSSAGAAAAAPMSYVSFPPRAGAVMPVVGTMSAQIMASNDASSAAAPLTPPAYSNVRAKAASASFHRMKRRRRGSSTYVRQMRKMLAGLTEKPPAGFDVATADKHLLAIAEAPEKTLDVLKKLHVGFGGACNITGPQRCHCCRSVSTPEWRTGPCGGRSLCNACGLRYRRALQEMQGDSRLLGVIFCRYVHWTQQEDERIATEEEEEKRMYAGYAPLVKESPDNVVNAAPAVDDHVSGAHQNHADRQRQQQGEEVDSVELCVDDSMAAAHQHIRVH